MGTDYLYNMKKKVRVRCWVDIDGEKFFGPGPAELLEHIQTTGSISKAAKVMDMSYKKAWRIVEHLNELGQQPYLILQKGGQKGGGAELTNTGKKVIEAYRKLSQQIEDIVSKDKTLVELI